MNMLANSTADSLLVDTVNRLFTDLSTPERVTAAEGSMDRDVWSAGYDMGLTALGVPEALGGSGGSLHDAAAVLFACGYHAVAAPIADVLGASLVASVHTMECQSGVVLVGAGPRVPWMPVAEQVLWAQRSTVGGNTHSSDAATSQTNYAGEPFAMCAGESLSPLPFAEEVMALVRATQMAGALQRVSELSVQYSLEREQFGKPIGKQQILQHYLAQMAGDAATALAATDNAIDIWTRHGPGSELADAVAAAKTVAGRAVAATNKNAHQLHGAIGYTDEHRLQLWTRRLWAWRDDFGTESQWAARLGRSLVNAGGEALWPFVTSLPPHRS